MNAHTILILGGYGMAGEPLARLLLEHTPANVILAGRDAERAEAAAARLSTLFPGWRARAITADAADPRSLAAAFRDVTLVVDCTPTTANITVTAQAALDAGVDYLDILFGSRKVKTLQAMEPAIRAAGRCFITEAGYHPGLPSALVRYAAQCMEEIESAVVAGLIHHPFPYTPAVDDLIREIGDSTMTVYRDGTWHQESWTATRTFNFGAPFGEQVCTPLDFAEMHPLPDQLNLKETGFYIAGMGWLADWLVFAPWTVLGLGRFKWGARLGAKLLCWATRVGMKPPYGVVLKLEATGTVQGCPTRMELALRHPDGYLFTAIPVAACIKQVLDGAARQPGLWMMGHAVDPAQLMVDMHRMGIEIEEMLS